MIDSVVSAKHLRDAPAIAFAGADIITEIESESPRLSSVGEVNIDVTLRQRPGGETADTLIP